MITITKFMPLLLLSTAFTTLFAATSIDEEALEFPLNPSSIERGNTHVAVRLLEPSELANSYPTFKSVDYSNLSGASDIKLITAKYAFYVNKPITSFSKEKIFNAKMFESIAKNTVINSSFPISEQTLTCTITKTVTLFNIHLTVDYSYYTQSELPLLPFYSDLTKIFPLTTPQIVTIQKAYDFDKFLQDSLNVCGFWSAGANQSGTIINCHTISSLTKSSYRGLYFFTNFEESLKNEILYSINVIQTLP
ncbi:MAG: hypothetical protein HQK50_05805 [Oligoflexia bacterium]|nr:hypothetical protein [Oligoflexia bacterium]MBF0365065.1 hypothetical protein [Oligoflexia bacterium]